MPALEAAPVIWTVFAASIFERYIRYVRRWRRFWRLWRRPRSARRNGPMKVDLQKEITIDFTEAILREGSGTDQDVQCKTCNQIEPLSKHTCDACGGTGQVTQVSNTLLAGFQNVTTCSKCGGTGQIIDTSSGIATVPVQFKKVR